MILNICIDLAQIIKYQRMTYNLVNINYNEILNR
jgi:hypothetical protein